MYPEKLYLLEDADASTRTGFASMNNTSATVAHHYKYKDNLYFVGDPFLGDFYRITEEVAEDGMADGELAQAPAYRLEKLTPDDYPEDAQDARHMILDWHYMFTPTGSVDTGEGWINDAIAAYEDDECWHEGALALLVPVVKNTPSEPGYNSNYGEWRVRAGF